MPLHADELTIDAALVRGLLDRQLPAYADAELRPLEQSGSSNALFRLGDDRVVRLPRQPGGGASILKEATWAPFVAQRVGVAVPEVVAVGEPDLGYPEHWSVTMWLEGTRPTVPGRERSPHGTIGLAHDLAHFLGELRAMDLPDAGRQAPSWYRGEPLHRLSHRRATEA